MNFGKIGIVAMAVALSAIAPTFAKGHDSNTLHKLGKAIQYPFNKSAQNLSVDAHRTTGKRSVMHRRNGNRTHKAVITPGGHVYRIHHHHHHH